MFPLILVAIAMAFIMKNKASTEVVQTASTSVSNVFIRPKYKLKDIDPEDQKGGYKTDFDKYFLQVANQLDIPFALFKAHAIAESSLKVDAYRYENVKSGASYSLMQVLQGGSSYVDRFKQWGYSDQKILLGNLMYDPYTNVYLAGKIIEDNLTRLKNLRDSVNAYNTGVRESIRVAPGGYVDKVLGYYAKILGETP